MNKQPILTGFPSTFFATAKRRYQASIRAAKQEAITTSASGYSQIFEDILPSQFLAENDPTIRQRSYGHIPTFWAWLGQIMEANASCSKALSLIQSWNQSAGLPVPKGDTSGFCQARKRGSPCGCVAGYAKSTHDKAVIKACMCNTPRASFKAKWGSINCRCRQHGNKETRKLTR